MKRCLDCLHFAAALPLLLSRCARTGRECLRERFQSSAFDSCGSTARFFKERLDSIRGDARPSLFVALIFATLALFLFVAPNMSRACADGYWGEFQVDLPSGNIAIPGPVFSFQFDENFMTFTTMTTTYRVQRRNIISLSIVDDGTVCGFAGEYDGDPIFLGDFN